MKIETLSFQEVLKQTPDIFEAVVVLSQRARQINARRVAENTLGEEDFVEEEFPLEGHTVNEDYEEEEKSSVISMADFLGNRLTWYFAEKDTGDEPDESAADAKT